MVEEGSIAVRLADQAINDWREPSNVEIIMLHGNAELIEAVVTRLAKERKITPVITPTCVEVEA